MTENEVSVPEEKTLFDLPAHSPLTLEEINEITDEIRF